MSCFEIESSDRHVRLLLSGDVTIEHASELHAALVAVVGASLDLTVEAVGVTRLDAATLQVLIAAAKAAPRVALVASSQVWHDAFRRFALTDPFTVPRATPPF